MDTLLNYFNNEEVLDIVNSNSEIMTLSDKDILISINKLKNVGCSDDEIRNIILTNPLYLTRLITDIDGLINKLYEMGFKSLNYIFDGYPFILNKDSFEIDDFVYKQLENGLTLEEIYDKLDSFPNIIDEV